MSLKKTRIFAIVGTFVISFLSHFAYQFFPNFIFSIIFPVNESVWEHMKILYTSIILYSFIDYFILKKNNIDFNNFFLNLFLISFFSVFVYLIIFLPIYFKVGENMFLAISIMLISYIIVYIISYYILSMKEKNNSVFFIFLLFVGYITFGILTYFPFKNQLFFDTVREIYGIQKREL